jgi:transposase
MVGHRLEKVVFGLKPTANYHKPLGEYLIGCGYGVVLVSGKSDKRNRELLDGRWDKHDTKDCANVADLISQGKCLYYEYPDGFGPDVSSVILGARGDPFRFNRANQVLKTAGLDLSANRSGNRCDGVVPVISKNGKSDLRYALYQAALIASTRNRDFIVWFTNKLRGRQREKGVKTKMRVKLSAKLLP